MISCKRIIVKGRVQGVSFRVHTRKQAIDLNLQGYVRNLENGFVEILAQGQDYALQHLIAWCHSGPSLAKVTEVIVQEHPNDEEFSYFEIR